jgi:hypothetical protein
VLSSPAPKEAQASEEASALMINWQGSSDVAAVATRPEQYQIAYGAFVASGF